MDFTLPVISRNQTDLILLCSNLDHLMPVMNNFFKQHCNTACGDVKWTGTGFCQLGGFSTNSAEPLGSIMKAYGGVEVYLQSFLPRQNGGVVRIGRAHV